MWSTVSLSCPALPHRAQVSSSRSTNDPVAHVGSVVPPACLLCTVCAQGLRVWAGQGCTWGHEEREHARRQLGASPHHAPAGWTSAIVALGSCPLLPFLDGHELHVARKIAPPTPKGDYVIHRHSFGHLAVWMSRHAQEQRSSADAADQGTLAIPYPAGESGVCRVSAPASSRAIISSRAGKGTEGSRPRRAACPPS
jgi:hypothetical protein